MTDLQRRLLAMFQVEHREHLAAIRAALGVLPESGSVSGRPELDEAFRRAHSLKGAARAVDLGAVETLAHRLEALFARLRDGAMDLDGSVRRMANDTLDAVEDWVASYTEGRPPEDPSKVRAAIEVLLGLEAESLPPSPGGSPTPAPPEAVKVAGTVRVRIDRLDSLLRSSGELFAEGARQHQLSRDLTSLNLRVEELERIVVEARAAAAGVSNGEGSARSEGLAHRLDVSARKVRDLSRQARMLAGEQRRSAWTLALATDRLDEDLRRARVVPVESLFEGFRKMVRDLAREVGKEVDLHTSGLDVEADRVVLEALRDPIMHLLRNAVDHGIETPEERKTRSKSSAGRIDVDVRAEGRRLSIAIVDDGRGIDWNEVKQEAERRGEIGESESAPASPRVLTRLLFEPGFSTSSTVTRLSGRGMGLSVVSDSLARLQGDVEVLPGDPAGTKFVLTVPLSSSRRRVVLVECAGQTFGLPVHNVERLTRIGCADVKSVEGKTTLELDGKPLALRSLAELLEIPEDPDEKEKHLHVVVLRSGSRRGALMIEAIRGEMETMVKDLGPLFRKSSLFSGGVLLPNGTVSLLLNPAGLLSIFETVGARVREAPERAAVETRSTILVVDDSITTRTLERSILEAEGYRVRVAVDGREALDLLRSERFDLVIADIEMPRLDGFGLLEEMKKDARMTHIPVIIVSSVESRQQQERGLALGADAYIVKRKFDQGELLETIGQIL